MDMKIDINFRNIKDVPLNKVRLLDYRFVNAKNAMMKFLEKMEFEKILAGFRINAGIDTLGATPYGGWENSLIAGHCLGHYFSACAQIIGSSDDRNNKVKNNIDYIIEELKKCQDAIGTGFLSAAVMENGENPEIQFDIEEGKAEGKTWVPWYAFHKVFQGMIDIYKYTGNETALSIAVGMGDWTYERVSGWDENTRKRILNTEYGGMNDTLYSLYIITGNDKYFKAAEIFDDPELYDGIATGKISLYHIHANTTIPKFTGALNRINAMVSSGNELTQKEMSYLDDSIKFFDTVLKDHTYITGGVGDMEHFIGENKQDFSRTQCNCESCCAYNMLKLSKKLYTFTGDKKYVDYYEVTLRNAIMGAIDHEEGITTYFSPMGTGYYKKFGDPNPKNNKFLCCTGTGMEDFTKLNDGIYYVEGSNVYINQFIASEVTIPELDTKIRLNCDLSGHNMGKLWVECGRKYGDKDINIFVKIPEWGSNIEIKNLYEAEKREFDKISEEAGKYAAKIGKIPEGYYKISNIHEGSFMFRIDFKMELKSVKLDEDYNAIGFMYGPTVLAAKLGTSRIDEVVEAGIDVYAPAWKVVGNQAVYSEVTYKESRRVILSSEYLKLENGTKVSDIIENPSLILKRTDSGIRFVLSRVNISEYFEDDLIFVPYNEIVGERYGIYWYFTD